MKYIEIEAAKEAARRAERDADYDGRKFNAECVENALDFTPADAGLIDVWIVIRSISFGDFLHPYREIIGVYLDEDSAKDDMDFSAVIDEDGAKFEIEHRQAGNGVTRLVK